jgi:hypothetical protein
MPMRGAAGRAQRAATLPNLRKTSGQMLETTDFLSVVPAERAVRRDRAAIKD